MHSLGVLKQQEQVNTDKKGGQFISQIKSWIRRKTDHYHLFFLSYLCDKKMRATILNLQAFYCKGPALQTLCAFYVKINFPQDISHIWTAWSITTTINIAAKKLLKLQAVTRSCAQKTLWAIYTLGNFQRFCFNHVSSLCFCPRTCSHQSKKHMRSYKFPVSNYGCENIDSRLFSFPSVFSKGCLSQRAVLTFVTLWKQRKKDPEQ